MRRKLSNCLYWILPRKQDYTKNLAKQYNQFVSRMHEELRLSKGGNMKKLQSETKLRILRSVGQPLNTARMAFATSFWGPRLASLCRFFKILSELHLGEPSNFHRLSFCRSLSTGSYAGSRLLAIICKHVA